MLNILVPISYSLVLLPVSTQLIIELPNTNQEPTHFTYCEKKSMWSRYVRYTLKMHSDERGNREHKHLVHFIHLIVVYAIP